jgi:hypothetical protein
LCTGDKVVFKFSEHAKVKGKIAWRNGAMAGVRFASPLPGVLGGQPSSAPADASGQGNG